jgi:rare lipoprotein A (peptidoglycan hydrolase)
MSQAARFTAEHPILNLIRVRKHEKISAINEDTNESSAIISRINRNNGSSSARIHGYASYYSDQFHGKPTASGEIYDKGQLTAAHPTFPFGSLVAVHNLKNGKTVVVRINDRGPFKEGNHRFVEIRCRSSRYDCRRDCGSEIELVE